jgi:hypothetical protein
MCSTICSDPESGETAESGLVPICVLCLDWHARVVIAHPHATLQEHTFVLISRPCLILRLLVIVQRHEHDHTRRQQ